MCLEAHIGLHLQVNWHALALSIAIQQLEDPGEDQLRKCVPARVRQLPTAPAVANSGADPAMSEAYAGFGAEARQTGFARVVTTTLRSVEPLSRAVLAVFYTWDKR